MHQAAGLSQAGSAGLGPFLHLVCHGLRFARQHTLCQQLLLRLCAMAIIARVLFGCLACLETAAACVMLLCPFNEHHEHVVCLSACQHNPPVW
jgi:hypothetical protein